MPVCHQVQQHCLSSPPSAYANDSVNVVDIVFQGLFHVNVLTVEPAKLVLAINDFRICYSEYLPGQLTCRSYHQMQQHCFAETFVL